MVIKKTGKEALILLNEKSENKESFNYEEIRKEVYKRLGNFEGGLGKKFLDSLEYLENRSIIKYNSKTEKYEFLEKIGINSFKNNPYLDLIWKRSIK